MSYNPQYNNQHPQGFQPAKPRVERKVVASYTTQQYGGDPLKEIQYEVTEIPTRNGGVFFSIEFFKNYNKKDGSGMGRSFNFPTSKIRDLIEKINHFLMNYATGTDRGVYIFQPMAQQPQPQPVQQPQMGYPQPPQPGYPPHPQYGQPQYQPQQPQYQPQQQPAQPQQQMMQPPPPGSAPSW